MNTKMSNTKLSRDDKALLKLMRDCNENVTFKENGTLTFASRRPFVNSKMVQFTVSRASDTELKFRKKVGEFNCLRNFENDNFITVSVNDYIDILAAFGIDYA